MSRRKPKLPIVREEGPMDPAAVLEDVGSLVREADAVLSALLLVAGDLPRSPTGDRVRLLLRNAGRMVEEARMRADRWLVRAERS